MMKTDQSNEQNPVLVLVDDDSGVLDSLERLLRNDFRVKSFQSALKALSWIRLNPDVSIIVSDYNMPGENGIEFMRKCRMIVPESVRVILSGQIELEQIAVAINKAEIHRFFLKPWENNYLRLQFLECLQLHASLKEKGHLLRLSITDPLTGLFNHRHFQSELRRSLKDFSESKIHSLSLIMIDVDHFKKFNDEYGHPEGDRLLSEIAHIIQRELEHIGIVCRYGGEEFAVILPEKSYKQAVEVAESLRQTISGIDWVGPRGRVLKTSISIGLATVNNQGPAAEELINQADQNLYQAKRQGRNQCVASVLNPS